MPIESVCPSCGARLLIPRKLIGSGRSKSCPKCHALLPLVTDTGATIPPHSERKTNLSNGSRRRSGSLFDVELMPLTEQAPAAATTFPCPFCRSPILQDASLAGQTVSCPHCRGQLVMPAPEPQEVACPYCKHLPNGPDTSGKVVVCPQCLGQVQMP